jgi:type II secretory pathway component PulF
MSTTAAEQGKAPKAKSRPTGMTAQDRLEHAIAGSGVPLVGGFATKKRVRLYDRLYRFTDNGKDILTAIRGAHERFEKKKDPRRVVWRRWRMGLMDGRRFSDLIAPYVPPAERLMLMAGEATGKIAHGFQRAGYVADAVGRMKGALAGALAYPALLSLLLMVLLYVVAAKLLPIMETIAPLELWPPISASFHTFASAVRDWGLTFLCAAAVIGTCVVYSLPRWIHRAGGFRRWIDHKIPPFTIYREYQGATLLLCMSSLLQQGTSVTDAMQSMRKIAPPWLAWHIDRALLSMLGRGRRPAQAIDTGLLHPELMGDIYDYDEAGSFSDTVGIVGKTVIEDAIERLRVQAVTLSALILFAVGGALIWVYAALMFLVLEMSKQSSFGGM